MNRQTDNRNFSNQLNKKQSPGENLTEQHPLLNGLILENVLAYLKGQGHATSLAEYRVICKTWDQEIVTNLRKETKINLTKILSPYPTGMGWTSSSLSSDTLNQPFHYEAPIPDVYPFENVIVHVGNSCDNLKNQKWIDWFKMMGSQVKYLQFSSPFTCFCQNHFLERILKEWCPNLESLELCVVLDVESLITVSSFLQKDTDLICKSLNELRISVDRPQPWSPCRERDNIENYLRIICNFQRNFHNENTIRDLGNFIQKYGRDSKNTKGFPEIFSLVENKVIFAKHVFGQVEIPGLRKLVEEDIITDGGIIGQIMKEISIEKLAINMRYSRENLLDLGTFLHIRTNLWRSSLKELELDEFFSKSVERLHVIALMKFPLIKIKLSGIHWGTHNDEMTRFLTYFSDTLEHLEISGTSVQEAVNMQNRFEIQSVLVLPNLPKLKTFVHENVVYCWLSADNLWTNAPNLKRVNLRGHFTSAWNANKFFGNTVGFSSTIMKEMKLSVHISLNQSEIILDWFPNLVKMELVLEVFWSNTDRFTQKLENSKVEQLKIGCVGNRNRKDLEQRSYKLIWKVGGNKCLRLLELDHPPSWPTIVTVESFPEGTGKLTSLKLANFGIFVEEKDNIMETLSVIPALELVDIFYLNK